MGGDHLFPHCIHGLTKKHFWSQKTQNVSYALFELSEQNIQKYTTQINCTVIRELHTNHTERKTVWAKIYLKWNK